MGWGCLQGSNNILWFYKNANEEAFFLFNNTASSLDGQVMVASGIPENRKRWRQEAPDTLLGLLAAAHLTSSSFSAKEGEFGMYFIFKNITSPLGKSVKDL